VSTPDTPDYQRGVVSAQQLLATVAAGTDTVTVNVPPNAETLIVCVPLSPSTIRIRAVGVSTGIVYATAYGVTDDVVATWQTQFFDCSSPLDSQVEIICGSAPTGTWYVYSDAGVHVVFDPIVASTIGEPGPTLPGGAVLVGGDAAGSLRALAVNLQGLPYAIPSAPDIAAGDHPPNELLVASVVDVTALTVIVAAPGAGKRVRVFSANVHNPPTAGAGSKVILNDAATNLSSYIYSGEMAALDFKPSGFACATDAPINLSVAGAAGVLGGATVVYTVETV